MTRLGMLFIFTTLACGSGEARTNCDKLACEEVKQDIRDIESRMRSGYSRAQGEKYEAKLRKLKAKRSEVCR